MASDPFIETKTGRKMTGGRPKKAKRRIGPQKEVREPLFFVPITPGGELAKRLRKIADKEKKDELH